MNCGVRCCTHAVGCSVKPLTKINKNVMKYELDNILIHTRNISVTIAKYSHSGLVMSKRLSEA